MREDRYEAHPLAELVPPMADEEYGALVADIAAHGLHEPIVLHEGRILDGRHRYRACLEAGVPPRFRTYEGDSPAGFVLSQNLHRRHLTPGQRAALALAVKPHLEAEARRRQQEAGRYGIEGGRGHRKEETLVQNFAQGFGDAESGRVRDQLADLFGVNHAYIDYAAYLAERDPDLLERVKAGEVNLWQAYQDVRQGKTVAQLLVSSESNEWYTPAPYVEAARCVLGGIDVDPASCERANRTVKARVYYTAETDGLAHDWPGRVWLNPPYGGLTAKFVQKLVEQYEAGITTAAILLVNAHATDTAWFQLLWDYTLCFTDHRIDFESPSGRKSGSTHGSVFAYLGPDPRRFAMVFEQFGTIVRRWQPSTSVALIVTVTAGGTGRRSTNVSARPGFE